MRKMIIGIHGLGNKPPRRLLEHWWEKAMREGFRNSGKSSLAMDFELAYWADIIHPEGLRPWVRDTSHPLYEKEPYRKSPAGGSSNDPFFRRAINKLTEQGMESIFLDEDRSLKFKGLSNIILKNYFTDLNDYFNGDPAIRTAIQNRLISTLDKRRQSDILLIAHSMGSIIAYDVLMLGRTDTAIDTLVTIGSPLGLPVIQSLILEQTPKEGDRRLKIPSGIQKKWYNLADIRDHIALDSTLADDYPLGKGAAGIIDMEVYNDYVIDGKSNPHKSYGYLRTPDMCGIIQNFIASRPDSGVVA
jgi:hypothetical protein